MPHHQHVGRPDAGRDPALLGAFHQVVHEHPEAAAGRGGEPRHDGRQIVDALQVLHDDPHVPQVIAPDLLHELGVVLALDVDPARPGHLRAAGRRRHRPGGGSGPGGRPRSPPRQGGPVRPRPPGRDEGDRLAVQQERRGRQREHPPLAVPVLERHRALLVTHHRTAEPALGVLHDQAALGLDLGYLTLDPTAPRRPGLSIGQHVRAVSPAPHEFRPSWVRSRR